MRSSGTTSRRRGEDAAGYIENQTERCKGTIEGGFFPGIFHTSKLPQPSEGRLPAVIFWRVHRHECSNPSIHQPKPWLPSLCCILFIAILSSWLRNIGMGATREELPLERMGPRTHKEDEECGDNGRELQCGIKEARLRAVKGSSSEVLLQGMYRTPKVRPHHSQVYSL